MIVNAKKKKKSEKFFYNFRNAKTEALKCLVISRYARNSKNISKTSKN